VCPHDRVSDLIDAEALCATLSELNPFAADPNLHNQAGLRDVDCTRVPSPPGLAVDENSPPSQAMEMAQIMPDVPGD
jgi:hypothetical protein